MSIISRAHALLWAAGNFRNERNSAAALCGRDVFPGSSSAIFPAVYADAEERKSFLYPREKAVLRFAGTVLGIL